jgi:hypothetical protein
MIPYGRTGHTDASRRAGPIWTPWTAKLPDGRFCSDRLTEIFWSMMDSIEIVETIPALREANVDPPIDLLKTGLSGPADALREDERSRRVRAKG